MKKIIVYAILLNGLVNAQTAINKENIKRDVEFLASDKLKGRGTSSPEERMAADYIAEDFKKIGLIAGGNGYDGGGLTGTVKDYLYSFEFHQSASMHDTSTTGPLRTGINVVGFLNNSSPITIVIGAHFDHLGLGHDKNSKEANPEGKIHNGADDNASGTAGVLELARYFANNNKKESYNFLFICFSGEELGLMGSKKWCENPSLELRAINYMINLDMVGRLDPQTKKLVVYGVGTSPVWVPIIDSLKTDLSIKKDSAGIGPSDQTSFYLKNIPVLHFFTGQHEDYHKPSDDADKLNYDGEVAVLQYIVKIIDATDKLPKLTFLKTRNPDTGKSAMKVTMGVMPDYTYEGKGLKIDGVTDDKPAAKAGIKKDDVIIKMDKRDINNIQDYMKSLSEHKKGDKIPVKLIRDGKTIEVKVVF